MMKKEDFTRHMEDKLDFTFNGVDGIRREGLGDLKAFRRVKDNALKKESKRLAEKLGADHPRVKAIDAKIRYNSEMVKDIDVLITEANIEVEPVDKDTWKVHGKVVDKDRKSIKNLTAALYDKDGKLQREMGYGCTNDQGYFSITYSTGANAQQEVSPGTELFLYISDKNHNILYKDQQPLFVQPGHIDYRAIYIADAGEVCTPPGPDQEKPGPGQEPKKPKQKQTTPGREEKQWVVEGLVKDEKNKPGKGVKVSLYDTKHLFDQRLGSQVTDKKGKFKFTFKGEDFQALTEAEVDIYLKVVDDKGKEVYTSPEALHCRAGGVDTIDIQLPRQ
jgi:5-hydroxyisourate hydrolase-like protein (transthyretin family)